MKRLIITAVFVGMLALFGFAGVVAAQRGTPPVNEQGEGEGLRGRMNAMRGHMGNMGGMRSQMGVMHEYMFAAKAEKLGLTVDELTALHDDGQTFWDIVYGQGLTEEEALQLMTEARELALDRMVADEVITQEQADWMKERGGKMMGNRSGRGTGECPGMGGSMGRWGRDG
jgi:predicted RNase H-like HicB family nuclease